ncbi:short chain enoyl-CoA hydratase [Maritimibacter sp. HL-12]|nr:short chain enoyl-CoA hydratase [Maritimibacter sp. HL-12]
MYAVSNLAGGAGMSVSITTESGMATVTIDNPPCNALNRAVREGLVRAVDAIEGDPGVEAVVLRCAGETFAAGADIGEFGQPLRTPHLPDVLHRIETCPKPWVAAIHGTALGGGLELAMACHLRVADRQARLGLPEVTLGLIPGAGGTVRLPRLVRAELAMDMAAGGKPIPAVMAQEAGLVDALADGDLLEQARRRAAQAARDSAWTATLARAVRQPDDRAALDARAAKIRARAGGQTSPGAAAAAIFNALDLPAEQALDAERATFLALRDDPQAEALRHVYLAERDTTRIDRLKNVAPRPCTSIAVIGGGTMGAGIAAAGLLAGLGVIMVERDTAAAEAGRARVAGILDGSRQRGVISDRQHAAMISAFRATAGYDVLDRADIVIEAVFEDMEVKKQVFRALDASTRPDAVLATNTSYLDVDEIACAVANPSRVLGLHFFSPAHIMKLLEIVVPAKVADDVLATGVALAGRLKKIAVFAGICDGFIANRIMSAYRRECEYMLEDGALPWEIDAAMTGFGLPMGMFQMQDLAGLDISWAMRKRQAATRDPAQRYVEIADKLCERGHFGRKTGRGWYLYENGTALPDPEVEALILSDSRRKGITRKAFSADEIMDRILRTMQSEGEKVLAEGIARNGADIDVVMVNAYGFPRWLGGPMFLAGRAGTTPA